MLTLLRAGLRDALGRRALPRPSADRLGETRAWLCRAHDAGGGGVSRSYTLRFSRAHRRRGWLAAYPETTGYIIPTFFDYAAATGDRDYRHRAIRMAEWEIEIQMGCGAVQGGVAGFPPTPAVFNTGQVLFGWSRAFAESGDESLRKAAIRAAEFLVDSQDPDGAWRRHGSRYARPGVNLYDVRTAWGLLEVDRITEDDRFRDAARRNLDLALTRQRPNGWFADCDLEDDTRPRLHTLAYAMEGLLEAGALIDEPRYVTAARRAADALLTRQRPDGSLAGCFDAEWRPAARWSCLTGNAQMALVWFRLFVLTGDGRYRAAGRHLVRDLATAQALDDTPPGLR